MSEATGEFITDAQRIKNRGRYLRIVHGERLEEGSKDAFEFATLLHDVQERAVAKEARRRAHSNWRGRMYAAASIALAGGLVDLGYKLIGPLIETWLKTW